MYSPRSDGPRGRAKRTPWTGERYGMTYNEFVAQENAEVEYRLHYMNTQLEQEVALREELYEERASTRQLQRSEDEFQPLRDQLQARSPRRPETHSRGFYEEENSRTAVAAAPASRPSERLRAAKEESTTRAPPREATKAAGCCWTAGGDDEPFTYGGTAAAAAAAEGEENGGGATASTKALPTRIPLRAKSPEAPQSSKQPPPPEPPSAAAAGPMDEGGAGASPGAVRGLKISRPVKTPRPPHQGSRPRLLEDTLSPQYSTLMGGGKSDPDPGMLTIP